MQCKTLLLHFFLHHLQLVKPLGHLSILYKTLWVGQLPFSRMVPAPGVVCDFAVNILVQDFLLPSSHHGMMPLKHPLGTLVLHFFSVQSSFSNPKNRHLQHSLSKDCLSDCLLSAFAEQHHWGGPQLNRRYSEEASLCYNPPLPEDWLGMIYSPPTQPSTTPGKLRGLCFTR